MKAIAIDDEPIALEVIRSHASQILFLNLEAIFTDAYAALEYLQEQPVDLIFLDIKMPDISGIEFFNLLSSKPLLIFTTAYTNHAATGFEMDAVDYLLKPISLSRFIKGCKKAQELYHFRNACEKKDHLYVKTGYEVVKVLYEHILYVEANGNYVTFAVPGKNILSRMTFLEAMNLLPLKSFVRVHRSYIVAVNKIDKVQRQLVIVNGVEIPVSNAYSENLAAAIKRQR